jgi:hypothetical protein
VLYHLNGCHSITRGLLTAAASIGMCRAGYRLTRDIAYALLPGQRLDIYVPTNLRLPAQVVVCFYSGRWSSEPRRSIGSLAGH